MTQSPRSISRRSFLAALAGGATALAVSRSGFAAAPSDNNHLTNLAWVWNFEDDGKPDAIRSTLVQNGLGILLKTHDGTDWIGHRDKSDLAIKGPEQVRAFASFFEQSSVPFHAWCVVRGEDPIGEAHMCAQVLNSGARSLTFDLEPNDKGDFWQAGPAEAVAFGQELRRLAPTAWLRVAPDPRPWQLLEVPMPEFAHFCNEIAPQAYWQDFTSPANYRLLRDHGFEVGPAGMTPEAILDVSARYLRPFGLPISPVGQGKADGAAWEGFVRHAFELKMRTVSVWRFGTADAGVWPVLREMKPPAPAVPTSQPAIQSTPSAVTSSPTPSSQPVQAPQNTTQPSLSNPGQQTSDTSDLFQNPYRRASDPSSSGTTPNVRTSAADLFSRPAPTDGVWRWPTSR